MDCDRQKELRIHCLGMGKEFWVEWGERVFNICCDEERVGVYSY